MWWQVSSHVFREPWGGKSIADVGMALITVKPTNCKIQCYLWGTSVKKKQTGKRSHHLNFYFKNWRELVLFYCATSLSPWQISWRIYDRLLCLVTNIGENSLIIFTHFVLFFFPSFNFTEGNTPFTAILRLLFVPSLFSVVRLLGPIIFISSCTDFCHMSLMETTGLASGEDKSWDGEHLRLFSEFQALFGQELFNRTELMMREVSSCEWRMLALAARWENMAAPCRMSWNAKQIFYIHGPLYPSLRRPLAHYPGLPICSSVICSNFMF